MLYYYEVVCTCTLLYMPTAHEPLTTMSCIIGLSVLEKLNGGYWICRAELDEHYQRCRDILPHTLSLSIALWLVATSTIVHSGRLVEPISYTRVASDTHFSINAGYIVAGTETLHLRLLCRNNLSLFMSAWAESLPALRFSRAHSLCAPTLPCAWQSLSRNALPG